MFTFKYPDVAKARRNQVLDLMAAQDLISVQDAEHAKAEPLRAHAKKVMGHAAERSDLRSQKS
jgi:membrane peptidoglycan carboxypeptidase